MAILEIKKFGCPALRKKTQRVEAVDEAVQRLVDEMFETMYAAEGIGLAAPQVGVNQRVVVLDVTPSDPSAGPMTLINPEVVHAEGEAVGEEGCLSLPGVVGDVKRAERVRVRALDREGNPFEVEMYDISSRAAQHEMDHLDGILVTDRFSAIRRNLVRGQLRRLKREGTRQKPGLMYADEVMDAT
ncbi:MAG: peptide deformylase [bacterium]|nr:peptide deformylase [bacterium]